MFFVILQSPSPSHPSSSPAEGGALPSFQDEPAAPVAPPRKAKAGASSAKSSPNRSANHTPTPPPPAAATSKPTQSDGILLDFGAPEPGLATNSIIFSLLLAKYNLFA